MDSSRDQEGRPHWQKFSNLGTPVSELTKICKLLKKPKGGTTLSRHIWELKDQNIPYSISWSIKEKCKPYIAGAKDCNLCIAEKASILEADTKTSLNSRSEMLAMCRHKAKFLLKYVK